MRNKQTGKWARIKRNSRENTENILKNPRLTNDKPPYDFKNSIMPCFLDPSASASGCHHEHGGEMKTSQEKDHK